MKRGYGAGRLWKRGSAWVLDYRSPEGRRRREALGTNKREAEDLRVEIISKRNRIVRGLDTAPDDIQLRELADLYLADLKTRATDKHVMNVRIALDKTLEAVSARTVAQLKPLMVVGFRASILEDGHSPRWANVVVGALQAALRWAVSMELVARSPIDRIKKLREDRKVQRYKRRALSDTEIDALLEAVRQEDEGLRKRVRIPQAPLWRAFLEVGARYGELRRVIWADIDESKAVLQIRAESAKSGRDRWIPLGQHLLSDLTGLKAHHWRVTGIRPMPQDLVFLTSREGRPWSVPSNNVNRVLRRLLGKAGIDRVDARGEKIDVHALRHSFASRLARNGVPLTQAQRLLGHSDPALTARVYTHLGVEDLRGAIETLNAPTVPRRAKAN